MRLFIAIPFSEEFKGELIRVQNEMRANGLTSGPLGNFGELLWIGLRKNPALEQYVASVRNALDVAGVAYDRKKFRPHITLVRKAEWPYQTLVEELTEVHRVRMNVDRVCLMKSERINGKLTYTVLGEIS